MASVGLYLLEGAAGLPVFAGFMGGLPVLFGMTGGYLIGFVLAAGLVGWLAERNWDRNVLTTALAMLLGNIAIYGPGLLVLALFVGAEDVLKFGLWPFLLGDAFKLALAAGLMPVAWCLLRRRCPARSDPAYTSRTGPPEERRFRIYIDRLLRKIAGAAA
jgi:biotin transport system substrate-specific component